MSFILDSADVKDQTISDFQFAQKLQDEINEISDDDELDKDTFLTKCPPSLFTHQNLREALEITRMKANNGSDELRLYIQRSRAWSNVLDEVKDYNFVTAKINVEFIGEEAVDTGGPTRELFSLVFKQVSESGLTRGSHPNLTFMHDQLALRDAHFKVLGQLVALALLITW